MRKLLQQRAPQVCFVSIFLWELKLKHYVFFVPLFPEATSSTKRKVKKKKAALNLIENSQKNDGLVKERKEEKGEKTGKEKVNNILLKVVNFHVIN